MIVGKHTLVEMEDGRWMTRRPRDSHAPVCLWDTFEEAASYAAQEPREDYAGADEEGRTVWTHPTHPHYLRGFHRLMYRHRYLQRLRRTA